MSICFYSQIKRLILSIILTFGSLFSPTQAFGSLQCNKIFSLPHQINSADADSSKLFAVSKVILESSWAEGSTPPREARVHLEQLTRLTEAKKAALRLKIKEQSQSSIDSLLLRLALNDEKSWLLFFEQSVQVPQGGISILGNFQFLTHHISPKIRQQLLKKTGERYAIAIKGSDASSLDKWKFHFEKRILSAWIKVLLFPHETIVGQYQKSGDPVQALEAFFQTVDSTLLPHFPKMQGYGTLKARDIVDFSYQIRQFLEQERNFYHKRNLAWPDPEIIIFGSTIKDLAKNDSDLDMNIVFPKSFDLDRWEPRWYLEGTPEVEGITPRIEKIIRQRYPGFQLELDHFGFILNPENRFSFISFSAFEFALIIVKADSIDLLVFTDQTHVNALSREHQKTYKEMPPRLEYEANGFTLIPIWRP